MNLALHEDWMQNFTFDELSVGQGATIVRSLTDADIADVIRQRVIEQILAAERAANG